MYQGCISFYSYIKPQHFYIPDVVFLVVYRSIPTSNRNRNAGQVTALELYIVLFLHQTATSERVIKDCLMLYIVLFLHQTATGAMKRKIYFGCISFYSYIKPQLHARLPAHAGVVYRSIPTSNRNGLLGEGFKLWVVYRSIPTSNRNAQGAYNGENLLYIVLFLHQTATLDDNAEDGYSCISFYSYIKPQQELCPRVRAQSCISFYSYIKPQPYHPWSQKWHSCISFYSYIKPQRKASASLVEPVVYRSIPTSNRNCRGSTDKPLALYIVLFLHQTATLSMSYITLSGCISFYSYIKPQRRMQ